MKTWRATKQCHPGKRGSIRGSSYKTTVKLKLYARDRALKIEGTSLTQMTDYKANIVTGSEQIEILTISGEKKPEILKIYRIESISME